LANGACQGDEQAAIAPAVAAELLHTATLFHDDVIDDARMRRGKTSINRLIGNAKSVLVGDFLLANALQLVVEHPVREISLRLARAVRAMSEGEILQLQLAGHAEISSLEYLEIITAKTGVLFGWCAEAGALVAGAPQLAPVLLEFGTAFGVGFQIADDLLDYTVTSERMGKLPLHDLDEGKLTLPIILAKDEDPQVARLLRRYLAADGDGAASSELKLELAALVHSGGYIDRARQEAETWIARAHAALERLPDGEYAVLLAELLDFVVERDF